MELSDAEILAQMRAKVASKRNGRTGSLYRSTAELSPRRDSKQSDDTNIRVPVSPNQTRPTGVDQRADPAGSLLPPPSSGDSMVRAVIRSIPSQNYEPSVPSFASLSGAERSPPKALPALDELISDRIDALLYSSRQLSSRPSDPRSPSSEEGSRPPLSDRLHLKHKPTTVPDDPPPQPIVAEEKTAEEPREEEEEEGGWQEGQGEEEEEVEEEGGQATEGPSVDEGDGLSEATGRSVVLEERSVPAFVSPTPRLTGFSKDLSRPSVLGSPVLKMPAIGSFGTTAGSVSSFVPSRVPSLLVQQSSTAFPFDGEGSQAGWPTAPSVSDDLPALASMKAFLRDLHSRVSLSSEDGGSVTSSIYPTHRVDAISRRAALEGLRALLPDLPAAEREDVFGNHIPVLLSDALSLVPPLSPPLGITIPLENSWHGTGVTAADEMYYAEWDVLVGLIRIVVSSELDTSPLAVGLASLLANLLDNNTHTPHAYGVAARGCHHPDLVPLLSVSLCRAGTHGIEAAVALASDGGTPGELATLTAVVQLPDVQREVLVPLLMRQLSSDDTHARRGAVVALGVLGPIALAALPLLEKLLTSSHHHARCVLQSNISRLRRDGDGELDGGWDRRVVAAAMAATGNPGRQAVLRLAVSSSMVPVRKACVWALGLPFADPAFLSNLPSPLLTVSRPGRAALDAVVQHEDLADSADYPLSSLITRDVSSLSGSAAPTLSGRVKDVGYSYIRSKPNAPPPVPESKYFSQFLADDPSPPVLLSIKYSNAGQNGPTDEDLGTPDWWIHANEEENEEASQSSRQRAVSRSSYGAVKEDHLSLALESSLKHGKLVTPSEIAIVMDAAPDRAAYDSNPEFVPVEEGVVANMPVWYCGQTSLTVACLDFVTMFRQRQEEGVVVTSASYTEFQHPFREDASATTRSDFATPIPFRLPLSESPSMSRRVRYTDGSVAGDVPSEVHAHNLLSASIEGTVAASNYAIHQVTALTKALADREGVVRREAALSVSRLGMIGLLRTVVSEAQLAELLSSGGVHSTVPTDVPASTLLPFSASQSAGPSPSKLSQTLGTRSSDQVKQSLAMSSSSRSSRWGLTTPRSTSRSRSGSTRKSTGVRRSASSTPGRGSVASRAWPESTLPRTGATSPELISEPMRMVDRGLADASQLSLNTQTVAISGAVAGLQDEQRQTLSDFITLLTALLWSDPSEGVREAVCIALGSLGATVTSLAPDNLCVRALADALGDRFAKVRSAATIALGQLGECSAPVLRPLLKLLRTHSVSRDVVAAVIAQLGEDAEKLLRKCLQDPHLGIAVRVAAAKGLTAVPTRVLHCCKRADAIARAICAAQSSPTPKLRAACYKAAVRLSLRADEQVPQLRKRQLLPVVFHGMHDPELEVRQAAAFSLAYMGPQGALLLIEGLQHDVSPSLRAACAFGLSTPLLSARTARVLLLALRDVHPDVVAAASAGLLSIGLFAILQELRAHGDAFKSSLLLLCDDILKQSDCGAVRLDSACKALVSDILR